MALKVIAPLVITKREDGSDAYLYQGALVPDYVSKDEVKRLKDEGFVFDDSPPKVEVKAAEPEPRLQSGHEDDPAQKLPARKSS